MLRLRLAAEEVAEFARAGRVSSETRFGPEPGAVLRYALERAAPGSAAGAPTETTTLRYAPGQITVLVPAALADDWTSTSRNGFAGEIFTTETDSLRTKLRILVEKDLDCRH